MIAITGLDVAVGWSLRPERSSSVQLRPEQSSPSTTEITILLKTDPLYPKAKLRVQRDLLIIN